MDTTTLVTLVIAATGAITGIASLAWHISNSRSKVIIDRLSFQRVRDHPFQDKEVIAVSITLRNKSNRSTTIEHASLEVGNYLEEFIKQPVEINPNSSKELSHRVKIKTEEFNRIIGKQPVRLGITINHTFGTLKRDGLSDFSRDSLLYL